MKQIFLLVGLMAFVPGLAALELERHAPVVDVEVIRESTCPGRPATGDLMKLLRWDLAQEECRPSRTYQVRYLWQGRTHTMLTHVAPGKSVPVRIHIRPAHSSAW